MTVPGHARTYRLGPVSVRIGTDDVTLLELFERDTEPFLVRADDDGQSADVRVTAARQDRLVLPAGKPSQRLLHARDAPLYGSCWPAADGLIVHNPHYPGLYRISPARRTVDIRYAGEVFHAYIGLRLNLFPLLYRLSDRRGSLTIHASAACGEDGALVFCGDKGAGKTSVMLTLVAASGYGLITNDYALVSSGSPDGPQVSGTPEPIRIGAGTFAAVGHALARFASSEVFLGKRHLNLREIRGHLPVTPTAPVRALFFPELAASGDIAVRPVTAAAAAGRLLAQCMERAGYQNPQLLNIGDALPAAVARQRLAALAGAVPAFAVRVPHPAIGSPWLAATLEDAVTAAGAVPLPAGEPC
ncbi:MAG TPA: hypothetical protein VGG25_13735 [Streptosporangiaceae bacterium]|jgi:hypothetical protein